MAKPDNMLWIKKLLVILPVILLASVILIIAGIILLATKDKVIINEHVEDYTNCISRDFYNDTELSCLDYINLTHKYCVCNKDFNLNNSLEGNIVLSYELEDFDQQKSEYINSRDDQQLGGILSPIPSKNCEPYRYAVIDESQKPIFPCGAIADSMFTDIYDLIIISNIDRSVPLLQTGLLSDSEKSGYSNPKNLDDLKNFSRPISFLNWKESGLDIWNFDPDNPGNNFIQNERFIAWMKTDWKRKPWGRVNILDYPNGLPSGQYSMRINYEYPISRYSGRRKFILSATKETTLQSFYILGILALVVGLLLLISTIALYYVSRASRSGSPRESGDTTTYNGREEERALSS